jgi:5-formyltetrahydrofolate cyclo-ligase
MTPNGTDNALARAKAALRQSAVALRADAHEREGAAAAEALAQHGMALLGERRFRSIAGYWPMRSEMDVRPLLAALADTGREIALPVVLDLGQPLEFRRWRPGAALAAGRFGTAHPPPAARIVEPDIVLVPLLAFDDRHHRLGYGAGFYDRTLAALRARKQLLAVGVAYSAQHVAEVPVSSTDVVLDLVLTERGIV